MFEAIVPVFFLPGKKKNNNNLHLAMLTIQNLFLYILQDYSSIYKTITTAYVLTMENFVLSVSWCYNFLALDFIVYMNLSWLIRKHHLLLLLLLLSEIVLHYVLSELLYSDELWWVFSFCRLLTCNVISFLNTCQFLYNHISQRFHYLACIHLKHWIFSYLFIALWIIYKNHLFQK